MRRGALWAGLRALRYRLPALVGGWLPLPDLALLARAARRQGMALTFAYFQGDAEDPPAVLAGNRAVLGALAGGDALLAVKAPPLAYDRAALLALAGEAGWPLVLDAHGPATAAPTHALLAELLAAGVAAGIALPARWPRSAGDAAALREGPARIRLVKGEWAAAEGDVVDAGAAYVALAQALAGRAAPVAVATHDPALARAALGVLQAAGTPCELELLRGLPRRRMLAVARGLGVPVRLYVPWGPGWWPYALNKALERPWLARWWLADRLDFRRANA